MLARLFRERWIEANPIGHGVGWHSYPIARRIVNWIQAFKPGLLLQPFSRTEASETKWLRSLYQQARYLEDHLEYDCLGNHLLANGKALVFAGLFFGGKAGSRWFNIGQRILCERAYRISFWRTAAIRSAVPCITPSCCRDYLEVVLALKLNGRRPSGTGCART